MLAYVLALVIGLGSFALYMAAFFFPEVHRKQDFIWSGVGLFYALVLWVCAGRITGGVLLGQVASVALLGWFGWQTLTLRRLLVPQEQQTAVPSQEEIKGKLEKVLPAGGLQGLQGRVTGLFSKGKPQAPTAAVGVETKSPETSVQANVETTSPKTSVEANVETTFPETSVEANVETKSPETSVEANVETKSPETSVEAKIESELDEVAVTVAAPEEAIAEPVPPNPPSPELVEAAQKSASSDTDGSREQAAIPIEEIAPEAELAPPAEPTGLGDPEDRKAEPSA